MRKSVLITAVCLLTLALFAVAGSSGAAAQSSENATVYTAVENGDVWAFDANTGEKKWSYSTGGTISSSPTVYDKTVFFGEGGNLYALDASDGSEVFIATEPSNDVDTSPTVYEGSVYVGSDDDTVYSFDAETGSLNWEFQKPSDIITSSPLVVNNTVYIGDNGGNVWAINASDGSEKWNFSKPTDRVESSPTFYNGTIYFGSNDEHLYALNAYDGTEEWRLDVTDQIGLSSPIIENNTAYIGTNAGTWAIDAANGTKKWSFNASSTDTLFAETTPTEVDGVVYTGEYSQGLFALHANNGTKIWNQNPFGSRRDAPTVFDRQVFVELGNDLYAFDSSTGNINWRYDLGDRVIGGPTVVPADGSQSADSRVEYRALGHHQDSSGTYSPKDIVVSTTDSNGNNIDSLIVRAKQNGQVVDSGQTDPNGQITLTVNEGNYEIEAGPKDQPLEVEETDTLTTQSVKLELSLDDPDISLIKPKDGAIVGTNSVELAVSVDDETLDGSNVSVEFTDANDSTTIASKNITEAGEVNTTLQVPSDRIYQPWRVSAKDGAGNLESEAYEFFITGNLTIRDNATGSIINDRDANLLVNNDSTQLNTTISDGKYRLPADVDERIRIRVRTCGYWTAVVNLRPKETIGDTDLYLDRNPNYQSSPSSCNKDDDPDPANVNDRELVRFTLDDVTGEFEAETTSLQVRRVVDGSSSTVLQYSDRFGGANRIDITMEQGGRYQLRIRNREGDIRELGGFTVTETETVPLTIDDLEIDGSGATNRLKILARWSEDSEGNETIDIEVVPPFSDIISYRIYERGNESNVLIDDSTGITSEFSTRIAIPDQQENATWIVEIESMLLDRTEQRIVGSGAAAIPIDLPQDVKTMLSLGLVVLIAGLLGGVRAELGAVAATLMAGILWLANWMPPSTSVGMIVLALIVAVAYRLRSTPDGPPLGGGV